MPQRPVVQLAPREHVPRSREGRDPAPVRPPGVPADVVDMEVGAHHVVDVAHRKAAGGEARLVAVAGHHVPKGSPWPRLVVADAGIDQDIVARRPHEIALDAEHEPAGGVEVGRLEPRLVLRQDLLGQRREELEGVENGASCSTTRWIVTSPRTYCRVIADCSRAPGARIGLGRSSQRRDALRCSPRAQASIECSAEVGPDALRSQQQRAHLGALTRPNRGGPY